MTQDIVARVFILLVLVLYTGISLVFVAAGIRKWVWRPIAGKLSARRTDRGYRTIKSTSHEGSPS